MKQNTGFTLIEMAFLIVIIGILTVSLIKPLSATVKNRHMQQTNQILSEAKQALIGYAVLNNSRLPCPDTNLPQESGHGWSNGTACNDVEGYLPWKTLGITGYDAWGSPIRYRADNNYTAASIPADFPETSSGLKIENFAAGDLSTEESDSGESRIAAIVFSCGQNQRPDKKNYDPPDSTLTGVCTNDWTPDYYTTPDPNSVYTQDSPQFIEASPTDEFDDILTWIPRNVLVNRLVTAGKWTP